MRCSTALCSLLALGAAVAGASAQANPRDGLLVTPAALASQLKDPRLVLLHVGMKEEFDKEHIPGARFVNLDDISISDHSGKGLMLEMPAADALRQGLAKLGISDDSRIVVYFAKDWVTPATRVIFTLDYAGLGNRSALLDGGLSAWKQAGNPVTADATPVKVGSLLPLTLKPLVVNAEFVKAHAGRPGYAVVDGRAAAFYDGVSVGGSHDVAHKAGHIAGAKSVPYTEIADTQLKLKSTDLLAALFAKAGIARGDTIIGYCHIGQQATGMLFAARSLGFPVKLYDGSFEDWSLRDLPVETAKKP